MTDKLPLTLEDLGRLLMAGLRREIAVGIEQADLGQFVDGEAAFDRIRQRSAERRRAMK